MIKPHNEPAFPSTGEGFNDPRYHTAGMSLRDYFAGQALTGVMERFHAEGNTFNAPACAARAYCVADVMIAERRK